jgi:hypothetical protein
VSVVIVDRESRSSARCSSRPGVPARRPALPPLVALQLPQRFSPHRVTAAPVRGRSSCEPLLLLHGRGNTLGGRAPPGAGGEAVRQVAIDVQAEAMRALKPSGLKAGVDARWRPVQAAGHPQVVVCGGEHSPT